MRVAGVQGLNPDIADAEVGLAGGLEDGSASAVVCIPVGMCRATLSEPL